PVSTHQCEQELGRDHRGPAEHLRRACPGPAARAAHRQGRRVEGPGPMSDLLYSPEEEALRAALRDLLTDHCDPAGVIARTESAAPHDLALWKALAQDMGLAGLLVPEELDGQGATHREAAVVLEELGRAVAPVPYLASSV